MANLAHLGHQGGDRGRGRNQYKSGRRRWGSQYQPPRYQICLAHPNFKFLQRVIAKYGPPTTLCPKLSLCDACAGSEIHKQPFSISLHASSHPLILQTLTFGDRSRCLSFWIELLTILGGTVARSSEAEKRCIGNVSHVSIAG